MTKLKVLQLGFFLALIGLLSFKFAPYLGLNEITVSSISNIILISLVLIWICSYLFRVINGKMTFMEQRKRYREKYENKITEKLEKKFDSLTNEEQRRILEELEEK